MPNHEYPQVIEAQEYPIGSMPWILSPLGDRERIILLAYYLGGMTPSEIAAQLTKHPNRKGRSPGPATIRRYIRSGRSKVYYHDNMAGVFEDF